MLAETGIGPVTAAWLVGEIAGIDRFSSEAKLARIAGCAPVPVSSGRTDEHRLDRGGNRQLNHAIHMIALPKIPHDPRTALYIAKQRERGKTNTKPSGASNGTSPAGSTDYSPRRPASQRPSA